MKFVEKKSCLSCGSNNLGVDGNCYTCIQVKAAPVPAPSVGFKFGKRSVVAAILFLFICLIGFEGYRSVVNHSEFGDSLISSSPCFEKSGGCTFDDRKWFASVMQKKFGSVEGTSLETSITAEDVNAEVLTINTSGLVIKNREDAKKIFDSFQSQGTASLWGFRRITIVSGAGVWSFKLSFLLGV